MNSLLILGEHQDSSLNPNIKRLQRYSTEMEIPTRVRNYEEFFSKPIKINTEDLAVMFFFPYKFWNQTCETPEDTGIYGTSSKSYKRFEQFWKDVKGNLEEKFKGINLKYIIDPDFAALDRDKIATHKLLKKANIPTTKKLPKDFSYLLELVKTHGIFIKPRYGALGKGITYLSPSKWLTNYGVGRNNVPYNYSCEKGWFFKEITGNHEFLKRILDLEMIVEKEIVPPKLEKGKKFDLRSYAVFKKVPYIFMRENETKDIITNFSQGGRAIHDVEKKLPKKVIELAKKEGLKTAQTLNSHFLGIDIIFDKNLQTPRVLEVQTFTGFPKIRKFNLPRYLAEHIKKI